MPALLFTCCGSSWANKEVLMQSIEAGAAITATKNVEILFSTFGKFTG